MRTTSLVHLLLVGAAFGANMPCLMMLQAGEAALSDKCTPCNLSGLTLGGSSAPQLPLDILKGKKLIGCDLSNLLATGQADFSSAELTGATLTGANLPNAILVSAKMNGVDLTNAQLEGADLSSAELEGAKLNGAKLSNAILVGAKMVGADLTNAQLEEADLSAADLEGATLNNAYLPNAVLVGAKMGGASLLGGTTLYQADLTAAELGAAKLDGANLRNAKLVGAKMKGASLKMAPLEGANLMEVDLENCFLTGSDLRRVDFSKAKLLGCEMEDAVADYAKFIEAELTGVTLNGMGLIQADFFKAKLGYAHLMSVNCWDGATTGCNFDEAELDKAVLDDAILHYSTFKFGKLQQVSMIQVGCQYCKFYAADISGENEDPARPKLMCGDFQHADFTRANMKAVDISGANCQYAIFIGTYLEALKGGEYAGKPTMLDHITTDASTEITDASCIGCKFTHASMSGLSITDTNFHGSDFTMATLTNTYFEDTILCMAVLHAVQCGGCRIVDTDLSGTPPDPINGVAAKYTDLTDAVFTPDAFFDDVDLSYTLMHRADLTGAGLSDVLIKGVHAMDAKFDGTMVHFSDFRGANLQRTHWVNAGMHGTIFAGAEMEEAVLDGAWGSETSFCGATLTDCSMKGVNFYKSHFGTQCNKETQLVTQIGAQIEGCDLTDADVSESDFQSTVGFDSLTNPPILTNVEAYKALGFNGMNPPTPPEFVFSGDPEINSDALEWAEAEEVCQTLGKTLAYIETLADNADVLAAATGAQVWIGLSLQDPQDSSAPAFPFHKWIMGFSVFSDINIFDDQPPPYENLVVSGVAPTEACVAMDTDGTWIGMPCNEKLPFVCGPLPNPEGSPPPATG